MPTNSEDEFDLLPNIYEGIDFDKVPHLCGDPHSRASIPPQPKSRESPKDEDDLFDNFSDTFENIDWDVIDSSSSQSDPHIPAVSTASSSITEGTTTTTTSANDNQEGTYFDPPSPALSEVKATEPWLSRCIAGTNTSSNTSCEAHNNLVAPVIKDGTAHSATSGLCTASPSSTPPSDAARATAPPITRADTPTKKVSGGHASPSAGNKRARSSSPSSTSSRLSVHESPERASSDPSKTKGKAKASDLEISRDDLRSVLEGYEDEMTCPICCDIFASAYLSNPCGHSVCGSCGTDWISRQPKKKPTCAVCRAKLIAAAPMIPNFSLDNTVERHVQALHENGVEGWGPGEAKLAEWNLRKEKWKASSAHSEVHKTKSRSKKSKRSQH